MCFYNFPKIRQDQDDGLAACTRPLQEVEQSYVLIVQARKKVDKLVMMVVVCVCVCSQVEILGIQHPPERATFLSLATKKIYSGKQSGSDCVSGGDITEVWGVLVCVSVCVVGAPCLLRSTPHSHTDTTFALALILTCLYMSRSSQVAKRSCLGIGGRIPT